MKNRSDQRQKSSNLIDETAHCDARKPIAATFTLTATKSNVIGNLTYRLPDSEASILFQSPEVFHQTSRKGRGKHQFPSSKPRSHGLTPREKEVLLWAARGKTSWETAVLLDLSEKTVKFYLGNARNRLAVQNKTHAVALCLSEGAFKL